MKGSGAGKGDRRRPCLVSREERDLRYAYAYGELKISVKEMERRIQKVRRKIELRR